jgi:putative ABC transport system permease protein
MRPADFIHLTFTSLLTHKLRSLLTMLGISVGILAVIILTSIGEGMHKFILTEFTQFGTTLVAVNPGKTDTMGVSMGVFGSDRPLSIEDAEALKRLPFAQTVVGLIQGNAEVEGNNRSRRTTIYGSGSDFPLAFRMPVSMGEFLPPDDPLAPRALTVLGSKVKQELFGEQNPIGQRIRIGGDRYRVIGVMQSKGQVLGFDLDDTVYIPLARGLEMFNREGLMEIDLLYHPGSDEDSVVAGIKRLLLARHGREDFTITGQQQMLDVMGSILNIVTFAVGAIGSISLLVGGIGIITIMTISVAERTSEIGLLRALGAEHNQIMLLFLGEAVVLSAIGGIAGLVSATTILLLVQIFLPDLPVHTPWNYILLAESSAVIIGLLAGVLPARRAAKMDPVDALRNE